MSAANSPTFTRVCDLLLSEAFKRSASAVHLEPQEDGYVVTVTTDGVTEKVMEPPPQVSMGMFVHLCQRAEVANDVCQGNFEFSHDGQARTVELRVVSRPQGKAAVLTLRS